MRLLMIDLLACGRGGTRPVIARSHLPGCLCQIPAHPDDQYGRVASVHIPRQSPLRGLGASTARAASRSSAAYRSVGADSSIRSPVIYLYLDHSPVVARPPLVFGPRPVTVLRQSRIPGE